MLQWSQEHRGQFPNPDCQRLDDATVRQPYRFLQLTGKKPSQRMDADQMNLTQRSLESERVRGTQTLKRSSCLKSGLGKSLKVRMIKELLF